MKAVLKGITVLGVLGSIGWWAPAAGDDHEPAKFQVNVDMVQLRATVTDSTGEYVRNLTKDDFRVFENGVEQKIRIVTAPSQPEMRTNVVILLDTSNQMYETFAYLEDSVADFIRQLAPPDAITVFGFSRNTVCLAPLSTNRIIALNGIRNAVLGDETSLYNSLLLALRAAERVDGSKVLVVFSNGPDSGSMLTADNIRAVAEDDGVPIYVVSETSTIKPPTRRSPTSPSTPEGEPTVRTIGGHKRTPSPPLIAISIIPTASAITRVQLRNPAPKDRRSNRLGPGPHPAHPHAQRISGQRPDPDVH